jgi:hypothetical protein
MFVDVPRAALKPVHFELIVVLAVENRLGRFLYGGERLLLHGANVGVRACGSKFHHCPGFNEAGIVIYRDAGNLEILESSCRLDSIVGFRQEPSSHPAGPSPSWWVRSGSRERW